MFREGNGSGERENENGRGEERRTEDGVSENVRELEEGRRVGFGVER